MMPYLTKRSDSSKLALLVLMFCYVFAFYIGRISISILISLPLYVYAIINHNFYIAIVRVVSTIYIKRILRIWLILVFLSALFPVLYATYDYSFSRIIGMQGVHFLAAFPFFAFLRYNKITFNDVEKYYIVIFLIQTVIQLIVVNSTFLGDKILYFNHFNPDDMAGTGANIRGKALSAATTYHLTMAYGFCFIIYIKNLLSRKASLGNILIGLSLFIGIFFAGRTGFVACLIGALGYLFCCRVTLTSKLITIIQSLFWILISVFIFGILLIIYFPDFSDMVNNQILPYAFEFLYSIDKSGSAETASTNHLQEMWAESFDFIELLFGSGKYTNLDGSYYMHVDPGVLRHTLFMGVVGYFVLIVYQLFLFPVWKMKGNIRYYYSLILLFLFIMEFKGVNIGLNKFAFSITMLLSFSYFYLPHKINEYEKCTTCVRNSSRGYKNGSFSR